MRRSLALSCATAFLIAACSQHDPGTVELGHSSAALAPEACVVGTAKLILGDRATTAANVATDDLNLGASAVIGGSANVFGPSLLRSQSTIQGDLDALVKPTLQAGAQVKGTTRTPGNAMQAVLPTYTFSVGTTPLTVNPGTPQTVNPGAYGATTIQSGAVATFVAGPYYLASLTVNASASLTLDTSKGDVLIFVRDNVTVSPKITKLGTGNVVLVSNGAQVTFNANSAFPGTIIAPAANVGISNFVQVTGCVGGKNVAIDTDSKITGTGSITVDTGDAGPAPDAQPDVVAPDVEVPDVVAPDVEVPDVVVPEDVTTPDVIVPADVVVPEDVVVPADVVAPDVVVPADVQVDAPVDAPADVVDAGNPPPLVVNLQVTANWPQGYCVNAVLTNRGSVTVNTWHLLLTMNNSTLNDHWSAVYTPRAGNALYDLTPMSWNAVLTPGSSANFGFCGLKTAQTGWTPALTVLP